IRPRFCAATLPSLKSRSLPQTAPPATARDYSRSLDSSFKPVVLIDVRCPIMPVNGNDHCKTNRGLGCRDGDGEDCEHYSGRWMRWRSKAPERDEIQVRSGEHHFNSDQDENRVTSAQCSEQADGKQGRGHNQESLECRRHRLSSITSTSAPIRAAVKSSPTHCNGHT